MSGSLSDFLAMTKRRQFDEKVRLGLIKTTPTQCDFGVENADNHPYPQNPASIEIDLGDDPKTTYFFEDNGVKNAGNSAPDQMVSSSNTTYGVDPVKKPTPYLGYGEYDPTRQLYLDQQRADYLEFITKKKRALEKSLLSLELSGCHPTKAVQTDIKNIHSQLVQIANGNEPLLIHHQMEPPNKPTKGILRTTPSRLRTHHQSRARHYSPGPAPTTTTTFLDGFSYQDRNEELELERLKREAYQHELRLQIEEKRRLQALRDEQERREQDLENRRLEQQLRRIHDEEMRAVNEERRHSDELYIRAMYGRNYGANYSPPLNRRHPSRFDSLSRIDFDRFDAALNLGVASAGGVQRSRSATHQDFFSPTEISTKRSPLMARRQYCYDDTYLMRPVAARDLKNSVPFSSSRMGRSIDGAYRKYDNNNIAGLNSWDYNNSRSGSILSQLGPYRQQLQYEQNRLEAATSFSGRRDFSTTNTSRFQGC